MILLEYIKKYIEAFVLLFNEMSIYLLLGLLLASLINFILNKDGIGRYLGKENFTSVLNSSLLGIPLPLCSCGVIPTGVSLYKNGASKGATISFLISTPQTGVDSFLASYSLLGLPMAIIRVIIAFFTGIIGGVSSNWVENKNTIPSSKDTTQTELKSNLTLANIKDNLIKTFVHFLSDIVVWLIIGIALAALLNVIIPDHFFTEYIHSQWIGILSILVLSIPMYICATGSIPIAAVLMLKGLSPGAAIMFLMAGPATNIATLLVLKNSIGLKSTLIYLSTICFGALFSGLFVDYLCPIEWFDITVSTSFSCDSNLYWVQIVGSIILALLILNIYRLKLVHVLKQRKYKLAPSNADVLLKLDNMSCTKCKIKVEKTIVNIHSVRKFHLDHKTRSLYIKLDSNSKDNVDEIINILTKNGYPPIIKDRNDSN